MRAVVISCFADKNKNNRGNFIYEYLKKNIEECYVIYSSFNHLSKKKNIYSDNDWIPVNTLAYRKNLSINRILSHILFSIKVIKVIKQLNPELIYIAIPPNVGIKFLYKYLCGKKARVIIDIVDLWPESFPIEIKNKSWINTLFKIWANFRNKQLNKADAVLYECKLYKEFLDQSGITNDNPHIIHLAKDLPIANGIKFESMVQNTINICYLGSINHIIDIDLIIKIVKEIKSNRNLKIHVIGEGNKREEFINLLEENRIPYIYYGAIYDEEQKNKIMLLCDFGINIYKQNTMIGLTYKSIDYFSVGLPILNSINGDSRQIVEDNKIGFNCTHGNYNEIVNKIKNIDKNKIIEMKQNTYKYYLNNFETQVIYEKLNKMLESLDIIRNL